MLFCVTLNVSELSVELLGHRSRTMDATSVPRDLQLLHQEPYQAEATRPHWTPLMLAFWGTRSPAESPETMEPMLASKPLLAGSAS